jgi:hypothetical protein
MHAFASLHTVNRISALPDRAGYTLQIESVCQVTFAPSQPSLLDSSANLLWCICSLEEVESSFPGTRLLDHSVVEHLRRSLAGPGCTTYLHIGGFAFVGTIGLHREIVRRSVLWLILRIIFRLHRWNHSIAYRQHKR